MRYFKGPWPDGKKGVVSFTFDCDFSYAYTRGGRPNGRPRTGEALLKKRPRTLSGLSRGLYGLEVGLPRIEAFLDRHGVKGTFFVPSANVERYPATFERLAAAGHEIGAHGHEHEALPDFRDDARGEAAILDTSLSIFSRILGVTPVGYRSPAWDMNLHTPRLLRDAGFQYDSSLFAGEAPYRLSVYDPDIPLLEMPIDWSLDDAAYFLFFKPPVSMAQFHDPADVARIWRCELDGIVEEGGVFTLTCHPSIIGRHHRMAILAELAEHAEARGDVWIAPLKDVAGHVERHWRAVDATQGGQAGG